MNTDLERKIGLITLIVLFSSRVLFGFTPAYGQEQTGVQLLDVQQRDLNGDGFPDVTELEYTFSCPYPPRIPHIRVEGRSRAYVYDGGADMKASSQWETATDFENDTWVFDVGDDGSADLIIVFRSEAGRHSAYVFDDRDGDGQVSYAISGFTVNVLESEHWTVKVSSDYPWTWQNDPHKGTVVFAIDGHTVLQEDTWGNRRVANATNDGTIDWETEVVDSNKDGIAEYQLTRRLTTEPAGEFRFGTGVWVNEGNHPAMEYEDHIFWPLLVTAHRMESYNYFDHGPALFVHWGQARVDAVGILGYPIETGYHINNSQPWEKHRVNMADFENPMAYYDIAKDDDGYPELFVRLEYFSAQDSRILSGTYPESRMQAAYSWDMDNNRSWDYKVDLAGSFLPNAVVDFADFSLTTVPYVSLPSWVTAKSWDAAIFIAAEDGGRWSSEGLYEWTVNMGMEKDGTRVPSPLRDYYLTGVHVSPPIDVYRHLSPGMRGEYSFEFADRPFVYFSPIDRVLHLVGADWGLWQVDEVKRVVYENCVQDDWIDRWAYYEGEELKRALAVSLPFLIYWDESQVWLSQSDVPPEVFRTLPPRDYAEWLELGSKLQIQERDFEPGDFLSMVRQFAGSSVEISGATVRDYRFTEQGFRFVLEPTSQSQLQTEGGLDLPGIADVARPYLVEYDGTLSATPLTPPALRLDAVGVATEPAPPRELEIGQLIVPVYNGGLEDAREVVVMATLEQPSAQETLTTTVALVPGEGSAQARFDWAPDLPGEWNVAFTLGSGSPVAQDSATAFAVLEVEPAERVAALDLVRLDSAPAVGWALAGLFLAVLLSAMVTGLLLWRSPDRWRK